MVKTFETVLDLIHIDRLILFCIECFPNTFPVGWVGASLKKLKIEQSSALARLGLAKLGKKFIMDTHKTVFYENFKNEPFF